MFCENCGKELKPGARFCDDCGAPVPGPAAEGAPGAAETGPGMMNGGFQGIFSLSGMEVSSHQQFND